MNLTKRKIVVKNRPFGMYEAGRKFTQGSSKYLYGFNGKENDKDINAGDQDYGMRIYDGRLAKFLSIDPITNKYPELTPYQFASNTPIQAIDLDGEEAKVVTIYHGAKDGKEFFRMVQNDHSNLSLAYNTTTTIHKYAFSTKNGIIYRQSGPSVVDYTPLYDKPKPTKKESDQQSSNPVDLTKSPIKNMQMSPLGLQFLTEHEGLVLHPYNDSKGYATVGIGHLIGYRNVTAQDKANWSGLTKQGALDLFKQDLSGKYEVGVKQLVKIPLTQSQYDAIVSFHYNTGALGKSNFLQSLNENKPNGDLMLHFKKPAEIISRRKDEVKLFNTGQYENKGTPVKLKDFKPN